MNIRRKYLLTALIAFVLSIECQGQTTARERLGMAIDYFQSGKYHESLLIFEKLDKEYELDIRYKAYIGVCLYYEHDYKKACQYLDPLIDTLSVYAPHEQAVYYNVAAESHFLLSQYEDAIPAYERFINVCFDNEKGHAFYRLAFCYMNTADKEAAIEMLLSAQAYYEKHPTKDSTQRLAQIKRMIKGLKPTTDNHEESGT